MEQIYKDRLLKLAAHLERGELGHAEFNFAVFNGGKYNRNGCGTMGCAIGECPFVWPQEWKFDKNFRNFLPVLRSYKGTPKAYLLVESTSYSALKFFGITYVEFEELFVPGVKITWRSPPSSLGINATKEEVAANIREFVTWKEKETE